jgi:hypothetical protein
MKKTSEKVTIDLCFVGAEMLVMLAIGLAMFGQGCKSQTALKANGVAITTVDAAMQGWAAYTQAGKGTDAQILTVSNAYVLYWNAELTASNTWAIAVGNTNNTLWQTATAAASASATNIINIISQFTKSP